MKKTTTASLLSILSIALTTGCGLVDDDDGYVADTTYADAGGYDTGSHTSDTGAVDTSPEIDTTPPPCHDHIDCDDDEICVATGDCERAVPHSYFMASLSATFPTEAPWGGSWDAFGGAPDPLVVVELNGEPWCRVLASDSFEVRLNGECAPRVLRERDQITFEVSDQDVTSNDVVGTCTVNVTANAVRSMSICRLDGHVELWHHFEAE